MSSNSGMWKYVSDVDVFQYSPASPEPYVASFGARRRTTGHSEDVSIAVREASHVPEVRSLKYSWGVAVFTYIAMRFPFWSAPMERRAYVVPPTESICSAVCHPREG